MNRTEKIKLLSTAVGIFIGAMGDLISVSLIMPLVTIAMNKNADNNYFVLTIVQRFMPESNFYSQFSVVCLLVASVFVLKDVYMLFLSKIEMNFVYQGQKNLAVRLVNNFFHAPYEFHLKYSPTQLQRKINGDVVLFYNAVLSLMQVISECLSCFLLMGYLLYSDFLITSSIILIILLFCTFFVKFYRKRTLRYGEIHRSSDAIKNKVLLETLNGMKEVHVFDKEDYFSLEHEKFYEIHTNNLKKFQFANIVPKYSMEAVGVGSIMIVIAGRSFFGNSITDIIPVLSVFVVAAFRMMPAVNRILAGVNTITFANESICDLEKSLQVNIKIEDGIEKQKEKKLKENNDIIFQHMITISQLTFRYEERNIPVLNHVDLTINKGESVAIIGESGAGKTTLVDLLLGLLPASEGRITVDGVDINTSISAWHRHIGYIPQNIYLLDDTIRHNICFGEEEIDEENLRDAVLGAQLNSLIMELPQGLDTIVGDRGVRLSGGQRQRIGIARALYRKPDILILDEATSALDIETESAIMDEVYHLKGQKTLIVIAHRLSTISRCDTVYEIKNGNVKLKQIHPNERGK